MGDGWISGFAAGFLASFLAMVIADRLGRWLNR